MSDVYEFSDKRTLQSCEALKLQVLPLSAAESARASPEQIAELVKKYIGAVSKCQSFHE
jgi:hypothetical protein